MQKKGTRLWKKKKRFPLLSHHVYNMYMCIYIYRSRSSVCIRKYVIYLFILFIYKIIVYRYEIYIALHLSLSSIIRVLSRYNKCDLILLVYTWGEHDSLIMPVPLWCCTRRVEFGKRFLFDLREISLIVTYVQTVEK